MPLAIVFYGKLADAIDRRIEIALPEAVRTVRDLTAWLADSYPAAEPVLSGPRCHAAIAGEVVDVSTSLDGVSDIEFFPPVSGG